MKTIAALALLLLTSCTMTVSRMSAVPVDPGLDETSKEIGALRQAVHDMQWTLDRELSMRTGQRVYSTK